MTVAKSLLTQPYNQNVTRHKFLDRNDLKVCAFFVYIVRESVYNTTIQTEMVMK